MNKPPRTPQIKFKFPREFMRVDFGERIGYADLIIEQHGYKIWYEKMIFCPCISLISVSGFNVEGGIGQPNPACPKCKGTGRIYLDGRSSLALLFSLNRKVLEYLKQIGRVDVGTVMATFHSDITCDYLDRFYLIDAEIPVNELFNKSADNTYYLQHNPVKVLYCFIYYPNLTNPENSIVEQLTKDDYLVNYDDNILTITKNITAEKYTISVKYIGRPWFYVVDVLHFYRSQIVSEHLDKDYVVKLPQQAICKRGDLIKI